MDRSRGGGFLAAVALALGGWLGAPGAAVAQSFSDVPGDHTFHTEIAWMVEEGLADGYDDGTFRPVGVTTRQAAAAFLHRLVGEPEVSGGSFDDVPADHPFHDAISWLEASGIAQGFPDGTFRPTAPLTRQAFTAFLFGMSARPDEPRDADAFGDVPAAHIFHEAISWAAGAGIADGYPDGDFRPAHPLTRQAVAAFLHRYAMSDAVVADAADARASGITVDGGALEPLLAPIMDLIGVETAAQAEPGPQWKAVTADEVAVFPDNPVLDAGVIGVEAEADVLRGHARATSRTETLQVRDALDLGPVLLGADAIVAVATATCPGPDAPPIDDPTALARASEGTSVAGLNILGETYDGALEPNTDIGLGTLNKVEVIDGPGDRFGYRVTALEIELPGLLTIAIGDAAATVSGCGGGTNP